MNGFTPTGMPFAAQAAILDEWITSVESGAVEGCDAMEALNPGQIKQLRWSLGYAKRCAEAGEKRGHQRRASSVRTCPYERIRSSAVTSVSSRIRAVATRMRSAGSL